MAVQEQLEPILYDKRVISRNVAAGRVTQKEVETHLAQLSDQEGQYDDISEEVYSDVQLNSQLSSEEEL